ncbi:MAG: hypothetical protein IT348_16665 [Candidatus Eisenbacteria bacterium]|nr:hypothetical protein [Candidatus Eisenbacteria bacterium]
MKRFLEAVLLTSSLLWLVSAPVGATGLKYGLELQGGMGQYTLDDEWSWAFENRWRWDGGAGLFAEMEGPAGLRFGTGLAYRRVGDVLRSRLTFDGFSGPTSLEFRASLALDQLALPARVEHAVPGVPALALELGAQMDYTLSAVYDFSDLPPLPARPARRYAQIFEDVGTIGDGEDVTNDTNRLGVAATAGLTWRTHLLSHDATLGFRYERGLTPLWKDGLDRFANRAGLSLRWAF